MGFGASTSVGNVSVDMVQADVDAGRATADELVVGSTRQLGKVKLRS